MDVPPTGPTPSPGHKYRAKEEPPSPLRVFNMVIGP